jgi:hypothetical protein
MTFALAWGLFAIVMPIFNRAKSSSTPGYGYGYLLIPIAAQIIWLFGAMIVSGPRNRREATIGILAGFGLELAALALLIVIMAALSHY